ncbi:hypothetical protein ACMV5I_26100, partial [Serratia sp. T13T92]|uniref:hypothetical protein n=1 Tax=Serratia sp. T13T92 TaxID=3397496 RepID=UPI0039E00E74
MYIPRPAKLLFQHDHGWNKYLDKRKRRWNPTCYCVRDVAMILFPIINTEQTHEEHPHARRMARPF